MRAAKLRSVSAASALQLSHRDAIVTPRFVKQLKLFGKECHFQGYNRKTARIFARAFASARMTELHEWNAPKVRQTFLEFFRDYKGSEHEIGKFVPAPEAYNT